MGGFYAFRMVCCIFFISIAFSSFLYPQLSKEDIRDILIIQGASSKDVLERSTEQLYSAYLQKTNYNITYALAASFESIGSGMFMGLHQSSNARYNNTGWLPPFMSNWYKSSFSSDMVFSKTFTAQKVFRELDYITDRQAYSHWQRFFGNKWFLALPVHWLLKNISGELIRHRMQYGRYF